MAKLTNVKTVDMVNGEITKVAYDGAEYAKVEGSAMIGDLVLCVNGTPCFTVGEFYLAWDLYGDGGPRMKDDVGDNYHMRPGCRALFRKISDQSPTIEERVTALESDVATLKSGESSVEPKRLTVGDTARIIAEKDVHFGNVGDIVKIEVDAKDHQPYECIRISDGKNVGWFFESELEAYAEETIEFEGATYRKVDREAREGDFVVLTGDDLPRWFTKGKAYKIIAGPHIGKCDEGYKNYAVYDSRYGRTRKTVDVYEAKHAPQVGDIVVVTKPGTHRFNVDDTVKIYANVESGRNPYRGQYADKSSPSRNYLCDFEVRKATPAEVESYEKAAHKASFAVGDYVKIVKSYKGYEGEIAKITEVGEFNTPRGICEFRIEHLPKKDGRFAVKAEQIVKATDAEIAKATAPKLKAGDYVKITSGTPSIIEGEIYEVLNDKEYELHILDNDGDPRGFPLALGRAKYEIVDAETAKWAKIGRKVNEFKEGDVVRVINVALTGLEGYKGVVTTVDNTKDYGCPYHVVKPRFVNNGNDTWLFGKDLELIAPVESTVA